MISYNIQAKISCGKIETDFVSNVTCDYPILIISSQPVISFSKVKMLIGLLKQHGEVYIYDSMIPDVPFNSLDEIINLYKNHLPSTIIAIGGGSVIDSAKAVSVTFSSGESYRKYIDTKIPLPARTNQLIAVPTTAGTGAELSYGAILYDNENKMKVGLRGKELQPDKVFIDFELYNNANSRLIAEAGFDCLTHAIETYISKVSSPIIRYQSISAIKMVLTNLEKAANHEIDGIINMAVASTMMGVNLALSSTCLPHRIQYVIGPETKTSHAQGLIALYKGWMSIIMNHDGPYDKLCSELGLNKQEFNSKIFDLKTKLDIPYTLSRFGIKGDNIDYLAQRVTGNLSNDPYYIDIDTIKAIIRESL